MNEKRLVIYTDGSDLREWLGFAAVCWFGGHVRLLSGRERPAAGKRNTTNLAELLAVKLALAAVAPRKRPEWSVVVILDSQQVQQALLGRQNPCDLDGHLPETRALLTEFAACEIRWERRNTSAGNRLAHALANDARWGRDVERLRVADFKLPAEIAR